MKRTLFLLGIIVSAIIVIRFLGSIYTLWRKQDLLTTAKKELVKEKKENQHLTHQLSVIHTQSYIEEQARDKLFLQKSGESEVVISQDLLKQQQQKVEELKRPNWQQWLLLFWH